MLLEKWQPDKHGSLKAQYREILEDDDKWFPLV